MFSLGSPQALVDHDPWPLRFEEKKKNLFCASLFAASQKVSPLAGTLQIKIPTFWEVFIAMQE